MTSSQSIAQKLPDIPRWLEARDLLLSGNCEVFGLQQEPELALAIRDPGTGSVVVVGQPAVTAIQAAVQEVGGGNLVALPDHAAWVAQALPGWTRALCILHLLSDVRRLPPAAAGQVGLLDPGVLSGLPVSEDLRAELTSATEYSLIAATFVQQQPVSFCYAGSETETLWDVAIDTLPEHRRQGHAAQCVAYMIRHMQTRGKQPVWAALDENPASWRLAQKIGFTPVDWLALFEPPRLGRPPTA